MPAPAPAPGPWPRTWRHADGATPARLGGISVTELAAQFGTPLFAVDVAELTARMDAWQQAAQTHFSEDRGLAGADVYYASKAFTCVALVRLAATHGLSLDTASGGELAVGLAGGMPPERIGLHGNNKQDAEIAAALDAGVGRIVADSLDEIALIGAAASARGTTANVFLRVTTGVHAGANEYIATAHEDQKFGIAYDDAPAAARQALATPGVCLAGLHMHVGSQISELDGHAVSARRLLTLRATIAADTGHLVPDVDLGGGYGITYVDEPELTPDQVASRMAAVIRDESAALGTPPPRVSFEPGRSIAGPSMVTLYSVGTVKSVALDDGQRVYVATDAGMTDNVLRPMLYGSVYTAAVANRQSGGQLHRSRVVGRHCESGDVMIQDIALPHLERGDLLAIPATGAYGRSMASNYNLFTRPPVVAVEDGQAQVWMRRETVADLLATDPNYDPTPQGGDATH